MPRFSVAPLKCRKPDVLTSWWLTAAVEEKATPRMAIVNLGWPAHLPALATQKVENKKKIASATIKIYSVLIEAKSVGLFECDK